MLLAAAALALQSAPVPDLTDGEQRRIADWSYCAQQRVVSAARETPRRQIDMVDRALDDCRPQQDALAARLHERLGEEPGDAVVARIRAALREALAQLLGSLRRR